MPKPSYYIDGHDHSPHWMVKRENTLCCSSSGIAPEFAEELSYFQILSVSVLNKLEFRSWCPKYRSPFFRICCFVNLKSKLPKIHLFCTQKYYKSTISYRYDIPRKNRLDYSVNFAYRIMRQNVDFNVVGFWSPDVSMFLTEQKVRSNLGVKVGQRWFAKKINRGTIRINRTLQTMLNTHSESCFSFLENRNNSRKFKMTKTIQSES